jgi:hypothetical protein
MEVVARHCPGWALGAAGAGEDAVLSAAAEQLPVGQEGLDGLLVESDDPLAGLGLIIVDIPERAIRRNGFKPAYTDSGSAAGAARTSKP